MFKIQWNSYRCNALQNHEFVKRNLVFVKHVFDSRLIWEPSRSLYGKPLYKTLLYKPICVCMYVWWYILLFHDFSSGLLDFIIIYFYFLYACGFSFFFSTVPPMIWIQNQLVGAQEGQSVTLECTSEAFPKSIDYWTKDKTIIISNG